MKDKYHAFVGRLLCLVMAVLLILAICEWVVQWFGYTFAWLPYEPGRLLDLAALMAIFMIAILLRQIRDILQSK